VALGAIFLREKLDRFTAAAVGIADSFAGGTSVAMALVTGPLIQWAGLPTAGLVAVLVSLPPLVMWASRKLGERRAPVIAAAALEEPAGEAVAVPVDTSLDT
jgi:hypothetical protein